MEETILKNSRSRYSPVKTAKKTHQKIINLSGYNLKSIPDELFGTPFDVSLECLDLSNNEIECLPSKIACLKNLRTLILPGNKLQVLPKEIQFLTNLKRLDLSRNKLSAIGEEINCLKQLEEVNLSGNNLQGIPCYLLSLPKLKKVFCIRNEKLENIPREVAAEGLQAMRDYLHVRVEEFERFEEEKTKDKQPDKVFDSFLVEIEKDWKLSEDQYTRKTKDVCIGPEFEESDLVKLKAEDQSDKVMESKLKDGCVSTQTDLDDSGIPSSLTDAGDFIDERRASLLYKFGDLYNSNNNSSHNDSSEDKSVERLVKIFHNQLDMLNEYKTGILLNQERRITDVKCQQSCESDKGDSIPAHAGRCNSCGLKKKESLTSEYGSLSTCSRRYSIDDSFYGDNDSCYGNEGSLHDYSLSDSEIEDNDLESSTASLLFEKGDSSFWSLNRYLNASKELVITQCGVHLTVPEINLSGHTHSEFAFEVVSEAVKSPSLSVNSVVATPIIRAIPHGAKFYSSQPAVVKLPINIMIDESCTVRCYESDTDPDDIEQWTETNQFELNNGHVCIKTCHFSLFCAVVSKQYPRIEKTVTASEGGSLTSDHIPGLEVIFTSTALEDDIKATMTALYDDPRYVPNNTEKPLASPVVALGPSGRTFHDDVTISLPLPNAVDVFRIVSNPELTIMESQTDVNETPSWRELHVPYEIAEVNDKYIVSFKVRHFTLYSSVWDIVGSAVKSIKRQARSFMPDFTYLVYFQALMGDCNRKNQFGLYVFCHRVGEPPITDCHDYQIQVGKTGQKELKTGEVTLRLKSSLFVADEMVGESEDGLVKIENFNGYSFDKQFNLRFIEPFHGGPFGKVYVCRKDKDQKITEVLDFNLERNTDRRNSAFKKQANEWESNPVKEMAGLLNIEDRWIELGLTLGYTRNEMNRKFADLDNPISAIQVDFKARGGEASQFTEAMYKVSRTFKLIPYDQMMENRENRRIENRNQPSSNSRFCDCPPTPERSPLRSIKRKLNCGFEDRKRYTEAKLDFVADKILGHWKRVGLKLGIENRKLSEIDQNNRHENEREKAFQMLITWREQEPDQCCAETLCDALRKCQLNFTAEQCLTT